VSDPDPLVAAHVGYVLALADDALVSAQRCGEWISRAPEIEEDIALANIGLDLLGQARLLFSHAARLEDRGRDEDDLAYRRGPEEFHNAVLCELPNTDFAVSMGRLLILSSYGLELHTRLMSSTDAGLAAIAAKAVKEVRYHRDHATEWVLRLGDGTEVSHERMQNGLDLVWPYLRGLFDDGWIDLELVAAGIAVRPSDLERPVRHHLETVLAEATLDRPGEPAVTDRGRYGQHTGHLGDLLAELQSVARAYPGATW
jgi:ring-1,2-phenylacetyl-CoA epoxidase subunit PaaC